MKGGILRALSTAFSRWFYVPAHHSFPVPRQLSRYALGVGVCLVVVAFSLGVAAADEEEAVPKPAERIRQLQDEAGSLRSKAETDYQAAEKACYKRFFVNSCIDDAKAKRLAVVRRARELEAEAHRTDLAERQRKAAEMVEKVEERGGDLSPLGVSPPSADADVARPRPETTISPRRVSGRNTAGSGASERAKAARRAEAARRDRERYDARIRELEEKKARDEDGR